MCCAAGVRVVSRLELDLGRFAVKDSHCNRGYAYMGAQELVQTSFSGLGANAVIGAFCSSASMAASDFLKHYKTPLLSPASTSMELSDSDAYPYFARLPPTDEWQTLAMADLVEHLLGVERVATVNSDDAYGAAAVHAFNTAARTRGLKVLASTSFANFNQDFSSNVDVLRRSGALVVVLICTYAEDASRFIQAMQAAGGDNMTYVGSEAVTPAVRDMVISSPEQASRLRGFVGMGLSSGTGGVRAAFQSRLSAFQSTVSGDGWCSSATDDDGGLLWSTADGGCPWAGGNASLDFYAMYAYDAVYTMAHAINQTLAAAPDASIDGAELMSELLKVTFMGASGLVGFDEHGDRDVGISYTVHNADGTGSLALLGRWQQGNAWSDRLSGATASANAPATYVSADGSNRAPARVSSGLFLLLGVLCADAASSNREHREECDHVHHTVDRINDKADGWYDELLPNHTIITATQSVGCGIEGRARDGWLALETSLPGFTAVIGPACSGDVADVAGSSWRGTRNNSAVVVSPQSTAPRLGDDTLYPNLARTSSTDTRAGDALIKLCRKLEWDRVAILHDDSVWAAGAAAAFQEGFADVGGRVLDGGVVNFTLAEFHAGTVHARDLLRRLEEASPSVIVVVTFPHVQRAVYAWAYDHNILYGRGYGWVSFWMAEDTYKNDDGAYNGSAARGAEGLIGMIGMQRARVDVDDDDVWQRMVELWQGASSSNCQGLAYCDSDGDPATWTGYSPAAADAVLLYAHAMDALLRRAAPQSETDPDALYAEMLQLPPFDGLAGPVVLGADGDRLGSLSIVNLQFSTLVPTVVQVGSYDSLTENLIITEDLVFSGGASQVPVTTPPPTVTEDQTWDVIVVVTAAIIALGAACVSIWIVKKRKKRVAASAEAEAKAQAEAEVAANECSFWFVSAEKLRDGIEKTLPAYQELLRKEGFLRQHLITREDSFKGRYSKEYLAVSHRWFAAAAPDADGVQLQTVREHLRSNPTIEWVWYGALGSACLTALARSEPFFDSFSADYWCMPQGERTPAEKVNFQHMLSNINLLYLGCHVLVLLDLSYLSRFWVCSAESKTSNSSPPLCKLFSPCAHTSRWADAV